MFQRERRGIKKKKERDGFQSYEYSYPLYHSGAHHMCRSDTPLNEREARRKKIVISFDEAGEQTAKSENGHG